MMKKIILVIILSSSLFLYACANKDSVKYLNEPVIEQLNEDGIIWTKIEHAVEYEVEVNGTIYIALTEQFKVQELGEYEVKVRAIPDQKSTFKKSMWSNSIHISYTTVIYKGVVILESTNVELTVGETLVLNAYTIPNSAGSLIYESSDDVIVTVVDGQIKANNLGSATVTVKKDKYQDAIILITVYPNLVNQDGNNLQLEVGDLINLSLFINPALKNDDIIHFSSSNDSVVFVGPTGAINALSVGHSTITVETSTGGLLIIEVEVKPVLPPVVTFVVYVPEILEEGQHIYLVGSFNEWLIKDEVYRLKQDVNDPLKYSITLYNLVAKRDMQYKYILGSAVNYAWEVHQNSPIANRNYFVVGGPSQTNDTVVLWQELVLG